MSEHNLQARLGDEIHTFIRSRKSLQLSSVQEDGWPYASYAPFAEDGEALWVLLSEVALHAKNLQHQPHASVLIIEDEDSAGELFARQRVVYKVQAELIALDDARWQLGVDLLAARHGERINHLSQLADFKLFRLKPQGGRYVKGFGRAFDIQGTTLAGDVISHLREGHKPRAA